MRVLFVCTGNINRSVAAEFIARQAWPGVEVSSAGLSDAAGGALMAPKMRQTLGKQEVPFEAGRRSQKITDEMVEKSDLILYMAGTHLKKLLERWPQHAAKFKPASPWGGVPDPHFEIGMAAHRAVVEELKRACAWWATKLGVL